MHTSEDARPHLPAPDAVAGQLLGGLLCGLLMVLPTWAALGTTTTGALALWMLGAVAAALLLGAVLRLILPFGFALCVAVAGAFSLTVVIELAVVAGVGDPPGNGPLALLVGLPAAALAAVLATLLVHRAREAAAGVGIAFSIVLLFLTFGIGPAVGDAIADARDDAALIEELEASGLSPHVPEIGDLEPSFGTTSRLDGQITRYSLSYETDPSELFSPSLSVDVGPLQDYQVCEPTETALYPCRKGDDYYVLERDGEVHYIVTTSTSSPISVSYGSDELAGLPDPDEIGRAIADAPIAAWDDILDLD